MFANIDKIPNGKITLSHLISHKMSLLDQLWLLNTCSSLNLKLIVLAIAPYM